MQRRHDIRLVFYVVDKVFAFQVGIEQPVMEPLYLPEKRHTVTVHGPPRMGVTNIQPRSRETIFPQMRLE